MTEPVDKGDRDRAVRYANAHRPPLRHQYLRELLHFCRGKYERVRPRDEMLHRPEGHIADNGVFADVCKPRTDETERLLSLLMFDQVDLFDCILALDTASDTVHRIGGIDHDPPGAQNLYGPLDESGFRVDGMDGNSHGDEGVRSVS